MWLCAHCSLRPSRTFAAYLGVLSILALLPACRGSSAAAVDAPRRIVLVVIDTLRADHVGAYGGRAATPNIDAFAQEGVVFRRAYSHAPVTGPSHVSMFTGLLPVDHMVQANTQIVAEEVETLAESLRDLGFSTAAFISLGVMTSQWGFAQGFDTYDEEFAGQWFRSGAEVRQRAIDWVTSSGDASAFLWVHFSDPHEPYSPPDQEYPRVEVVLDGRVVGTVEANGYSWDLPVRIAPGEHVLVFRAATGETESEVVFRSIHETGGNARLTLGPGWAEDEGSAPIWWNASTLPSVVRIENPLQRDLQTNLRFFCHEKLGPEEIRQRYRQEVEYVDDQFGRLMEGLRAQGWWNDSLIILTSDHGEGLGDHGLVGHIEQLYETLVHVPLIVASPGRIEPAVVDSVVRHVDLAATIFDYLGRGDRYGRGRSLRPLIEKEVESRRRPAVSLTYRPTASTDRQSLVLGSLKLIHSPLARELELYDLSADPGESRNLASLDARRLEMLRARLERLLEPVAKDGPRAARAATIDEEEERQLRALGYVR